jgi:hypothetical protein
MKFKTILLSTTLFFFFANDAIAQANKFIEIISLDTVELKPIEFTYQVSSGTDLTAMRVQNDRPDNIDIPFPVNSIKKILDKNNFSYQLKATNNYSISPSKSPDSTITITVNSDSALKRLYRILQNVKGITGKITDTKYESISPYKTEIYQRLYSKALTDATTLARVSGNSIGSLISVQEVLQESDFFSNYMEMMKKMSGLGGMFSEMFGLENNVTQKVEKKLLFRFELK